MNDEVPRVIIGRQPIYDRAMNVYAYELLFRTATHNNSAEITSENADLATSRVINHVFMELGAKRVIGEHIGFINLTRSFLLSDDPLPFTQEKIVLEVLEDIEIDQPLLDAIQKLVSQGYTLALDDFVYNEQLAPLVQMAKIIKVDILDVDAEVLTNHVKALKKYPVRLLAEKIETKDQFILCKDLGFELFQGFYFCRPTIIEDKPFPENHIKLFKIIERLQDPNVEFDEIEQLIVQEAALSYKLLRLLNSAAMSLRQKVDSIQRGLIILGLKAIRTWTTMIALNSINSVNPELMTNALVRAKMCENLAPSYGFSEQTAFLTGLFSNLDAMTGISMDNLMISMPLSGEIKLALTEQGGPLGKMLEHVIAYEQGRWDDIDTQEVFLEDMSDFFVRATDWTIQNQALI